MKTNRIIYLAAALALTAGATSCEHDEIYEPLEFSVRLSPTNTYRVGDPVIFNFEGNADYITVWNGDTGHEYKYRDRTQVALEEIESCLLTIEISQQYGGNADVSNLDMIVGNKFQGLSGNDAEADRPIVEAIAQSNYADWEVLPYTPNKSNIFETYTYDITPYADNFSFGLHLYQDPGTAMRTYRINPSITVKLKGYDTQEYPYSSMKFITFSLAPQHADDPYIHNVSGNGNLKLQGEAGSNSAANIVFQGFNAGVMEQIEQWAFSQPIALNSISPDTGQSIKGVTDDVPSYSYVYNTPGTYTATFLVGTGNYQGESGIKTYEVTFTVVDRIE